jgi:hypothetical protein
MQCSMRNQYSGLFTCMNYLHVLCMILMVLNYILCMTHGVYLRILWSIYIYKFNRCHAVIFTVFSFHLLIFDKNRPVSAKIRPEITTPIFFKKRRFIGETSRISVFPVFTVPPSSPVCFNQIFSNFTDFSQFF